MSFPTAKALANRAAGTNAFTGSFIPPSGRRAELNASRRNRSVEG
jgi:hypothetical protein